jgi:hypothetical protein
MCIGRSLGRSTPIASTSCETSAEPLTYAARPLKSEAGRYNAEAPRALRQDDPMPGKQAARLVDERGPPPHEPLADAVQGLDIQLLLALERDKAHGWAQCG